MTRFLPFSGSLLLAAALILSLSACDSGGSNDDEPDAVDDGRVEVSIGGDAKSSFDGYAYFYEGTDPETEQTVFGIVLSNTNDANPDLSGQFIVIARQSGRPGTGQHAFFNYQQEEDLQPSQFAAFISSATTDGSSVSFYASTGGALTITSSSDDEVAGSFEIDAVGFRLSDDGQSTEEVNITIEGAFNADPTPTMFMPFAGAS